MAESIEITAPAGTVYRFRRTTETKTAAQLAGDEMFADGAILLHLSFQRTWIYAKCVKDGKPLRRRFRYDQMVSVEKLERA